MNRLYGNDVAHVCVMSSNGNMAAYDNQPTNQPTVRFELMNTESND